MRGSAGRRGRNGLLFAGVVTAAMALAGMAFAFFVSSDSSNPAAAVADSIQAGNTPTLGSINGQDVTLNWSATTTAGGAAVSGYTVNRYTVSSGGTPTAATGGCAGTVAALTCTEQSVPAGTWYYTVTPMISLWSGAESGRLSVPVVAASFTVTASQWVRATAAVSGGSIAHFKNNETVVFHLDSSSGTTMTGSVSAVGSSGSASGFTVTVPGGTAEGSHTIVAVGGSGSQATSNSFSVDNTAPVTTDNTATIGSGWFNVTKTVTLTPSDSGSGVAATYYTTDGSTPTTSSSSGTSVTLSTDGVYTVKYFSVDNAGNTEAVKTAGTAIHIDKTNPTPAALSLPSYIKNGQALTDAATDPTVNGASSGVASVAYNYCSGVSCTPSTLIGSSSTGPNYSVTWSSQPADGTYRVQAVVTDNAGNTASSSIVSTTVDNTAPSGGSVTYTNGYFTSASISVTFSNGTDSGSGINTATTQLQRASATLSGGTCGTFGSFSNIGPAAPTSPYADTSVVGGNCYEYQYLVSDNVGNTTTYTSASVAKVDTTAPVFTVATSGANIYATGMTVWFNNPAGSRSFTVTASDPESEISGSPSFPAAPTGWSVSGSGNARTYT
ncbi:MAG: chitobiase/beta-hexosaminidase C-terminal domain-containing protein, partial [Acidimicrobiia bacterium]|nr:chitobiase/beta-hexosaminidase C-terminal domain-containing protein [Acidimicrobiia bacterium]